MIQTINRIASLQVLRGIAAILVLLSHAEGLKNQIGYAGSSHLFWFGYLGVDIFFVLSGFIIYHTNQTKSGIDQAKNFLLSRFARIFPIYWVAMAVVIGASFILVLIQGIHSHNSVYELIQRGGAKLILVSMSLIPYNMTPIIGVSWTLSFEIIFYLIFGLFYFWKPKLFFMVLITWIIACYTAELLHLDIQHVSGYTMVPFLNPIVLEFFYGCLLAVIIVKFPPRYGLFYIFLSLILFSFATIFFREHDTILYREFTFGLPAVLAIYGLIGMQLAFPKILTYLGDASYSIYLFHIFFLSAVSNSPIAFKLVHYIGNVLGVSAVYLLVLLICCFVHSWIENPLVIYCKNKLLSLKKSSNSSQSIPILEPLTSNTFNHVEL